MNEIMAFCLETIEYEAQLKHQNEMKKLEAELKGKYVTNIHFDMKLDSVIK